MYGTSKFTGRPRGSEFDIDPIKHPAAYQAAALTKPTRFDLEKGVVVNYSATSTTTSDRLTEMRTVLISGSPRVRTRSNRR